MRFSSFFSPLESSEMTEVQPSNNVKWRNYIHFDCTRLIQLIKSSGFTSFFVYFQLVISMLWLGTYWFLLALIQINLILIDFILKHVLWKCVSVVWWPLNTFLFKHKRKRFWRYWKWNNFVANQKVRQWVEEFCVFLNLKGVPFFWLRMRDNFICKCLFELQNTHFTWTLDFFLKFYFVIIDEKKLVSLFSHNFDFTKDAFRYLYFTTEKVWINEPNGK